MRKLQGASQAGIGGFVQILLLRSTYVANMTEIMREAANMKSSLEWTDADADASSSRAASTELLEAAEDTDTKSVAGLVTEASETGETSGSGNLHEWLKHHQDFIWRLQVTEIKFFCTVRERVLTPTQYAQIIVLCAPLFPDLLQMATWLSLERTGHA